MGNIELLDEHIEDLNQIQGWGASFHEWKQTTAATLVHLFGDSHRYVNEFDRISWTVGWAPSSPADRHAAFQSGKSLATGLLRGAQHALLLAESSSASSDAGIDPELWEHVRHLVESGQWSQVASQTAIFVESAVRRWSGSPTDLYGRELMTKVFKPEQGVFPLGTNGSEEQGWHNLALGIAGALSNVDRHRLQDRPDLQAYAVGVLGAGSLLLTQLRYQHATRFRSSEEG